MQIPFAYWQVIRRWVPARADFITRNKMSQSELNFPVHQIENNPESERHLTDNKIHFSKKCILLLQRLCNGERLKFAEEVKTIGDLRRRSLDLIQQGIPVQRTFEGSIKEYYLLESDILWIKSKYKEFLTY